MDRTKLDIQLTILKWYEDWSEEHHAAGFRTPDHATVRSFARHLGEALRGESIELEGYEAALLEKFAALLGGERRDVSP